MTFRKAMWLTLAAMAFVFAAEAAVIETLVARGVVTIRASK